MALYLAADIMLVTALKDGMNLVAKEYVASPLGWHRRLWCSEFTGAATANQRVHVHLTIRRSFRRSSSRRRRPSLRIAGRDAEDGERPGEFDVDHWADSFPAELRATASPGGEER